MLSRQACGYEWQNKHKIRDDTDNWAGTEGHREEETNTVL